ncbi:MAG: hypothetical protein AAF206_20880 [Bacteroidota bacterium]
MSLSYQGKIRRFVELIMLDGRLYFFSSFFNEKKNKNYLMMERLDPMSLQPKGEPIKLMEIEAEKRKNRGSFDITVSRDSSKVMAFANKPYQKNDSETVAVAVFDSKMQELWTRDITIPYSDKLFGVRSRKVSNNGEVYFAGRLSESKAEIKAKKKRDGNVDRSNYRYKLLAYRKNGTEEKEYDLDLGEDFISGYQYRIGPNGDILCGGFYSERKKGLKGMFTFTIDNETGDLKNKRLTPFAESFLRKMIGERRTDKGKGLSNYYLDRLIVRGDGGMVLVGEEFYTITHTRTNSQGQTSTYTTFHYLDILVVNIGPEGEVEWYKNIPKRQEGRTRDFSSYRMMIEGGKLHFLFNDHEDNIASNRQGNLRNFTGSKRGRLGMVTLDAEGKMSSTALVKSKDVGVYMMPGLSIQYSNKNMLVYAEKRKKYRFGRLTF